MGGDSLVATRARRANAGSRLKKLIELEEQSIEERASVVYTEDDENVNLLFQEDENDEEFAGSSQDEDEVGHRDEASENATSSDEACDTSKKRKHDPQPDADEDLSESELSESDSDESEGEKELKRQEHSRKSKIRKKNNVIPTIRQPKQLTAISAKQSKPHKPRMEFTVQSLLSGKRASSRSTVMESKQALANRLKADEERRALLQPVVRPKEVEMTQEERLAEAVETERQNVLSLNQFREQEIVKKEHQRRNLMLKRVKLRNVVRLLSEEDYVTPFDEITEARKVYEKLLQRHRRKPGRKKKIEPETPLPRKPGEIDADLPWLKRENELKVPQQEIAAESRVEKSNTENETGAKVDPELGEHEADTISELQASLRKEEVPIPSDPYDAFPQSNNTHLVESNNVADTLVLDGQDLKIEPNEAGCKDVEIRNGVPPASPSSIGHNRQDDEMDNARQLLSANDKPGKIVRFTDDVDDHESSFTPQQEDSTIVEADGSDVSNPAEVFEGPPQMVSRNWVILLDFDEERLYQRHIKSILFGKQSLLPATRRFKDLKQIAKIGEIDNPYAVSIQKKDDLFEPALNLTEDDVLFEELRRLPKFGDFEDFVEEVEENNEQVTSEIRLQTEAPTSLYLPNGNKKHCLITGTEVKYFDPANGIPYSSVDTYRLLKQIEQGTIPWYSFGDDANDNGGADFYLGSREGTRHAKGVPEGFDA